NQELEEGLVSISAPIRERSGHILAAMNISGQANRTSPQQMVRRFLPPLRSAADQLTELMQRKA
ncbi:MAG TPA: IclR family transcriptional regulator C-terminal domain-containing protein, partial [Myxococcales bacterium]